MLDIGLNFNYNSNCFLAVKKLKKCVHCLWQLMKCKKDKLNGMNRFGEKHKILVKRKKRGDLHTPKHVKLGAGSQKAKQ